MSINLCRVSTEYCGPSLFRRWLDYADSPFQRVTSLEIVSRVIPDGLLVKGSFPHLKRIVIRESAMSSATREHLDSLTLIEATLEHIQPLPVKQDAAQFGAIVK